MVTGRLDRTNLPRTSLKLDGSAVSLDRNGAFSVSLSLVEGANTFTLTTENIYGNQASAKLNINRNSILPSIRILSSLPATTA